MMDRTTTSREHPQAKLTTADLAAASRPGDEEARERRDDAAVRSESQAREEQRQEQRQEQRLEQRPEQRPEHRPEQRHAGEELAALFAPEVANGFRGRWDAVQIGFVDDPAKAVREADELVAQVMKSLAESFAHERQRFEGEMGDGGTASTEHQRVALRRYRSFFQRLLSL